MSEENKKETKAGQTPAPKPKGTFWKTGKYFVPIVLIAAVLAAWQVWVHQSAAGTGQRTLLTSPRPQPAAQPVPPAPQEAPPPAGPAPVTLSDAEQILLKCASTYAEAQSWRASYSVDSSASVQAGAKRPNKYYEVSQGEGPGGISLGSATVCDGANVFTYVEALKQALRGPAPTDLAELSKALSPEIPLEVNEVSLMAGINPLENLGSVSLNGTEDVNGRSCYVLDLDFQPQKAQESVKGLLQKEEQSKEPPKEMPFRATGGKERLWVDTRDYLIRKLRLDMQMDLRNAAAGLFGGQALSYAMPEAMDKTVIQTYSDVRLNENLPDDWFAFHIPEGVKIVDHLDFSSLLYDIMGGE